MNPQIMSSVFCNLGFLSLIAFWICRHINEIKQSEFPKSLSAPILSMEGENHRSSVSMAEKQELDKDVQVSEKARRYNIMLLENVWREKDSCTLT